jgi:SAM-dependent methyltransferase
LLDQIRGTKPWIGAGIESNREACKVAAGKGLEVWCCHAEGAVDVIPKDRHFDVVFMAQTIEHLDDPLKALIRLRQLLAPKGLIVISTPNLDSVEIDWYGPTWAHWHAPYHRFVFSRRGLTALAREAGLMPCCYRSFSHAYWSAMSLSLNKLGVAGAVPHTCRFDFAVRQSATRIDMIKSLLHNRLGRGDYSFMAMKELVDA